MIKDTIVALSTPYGESGIGVIRLTGNECERLAKNAFKKNTIIPRHAYFAKYENVSGECIDNVLFTYFEKNSSFTGDEILEISCHGNPIIIKMIIRDLINRGCRHANAGEFTQRAFINGKIDLCQAEAVLDLIHAKSEFAAKIAQKQLDGNLSVKINTFIDNLLESIAFVEAYLDFPEEDLPAEDKTRIIGYVDELLLEVDVLLQMHSFCPTLSDGIKTIIVGPPNAGKSTLLNTILGHERAIVSDIPGTTRDFIAEFLHIDQYGLRLVDTAGLHDSSDIIELKGMEKTIEQINNADVVILMLDKSKPMPKLPQILLEKLSKNNAVIIVNKIDLPPINNEINTVFPEINKLEASLITPNTAFPKIKSFLLNFLNTKFNGFTDVTFLIHERHANSLKVAKNSLENAKNILLNNGFDDCLAFELKHSMYALEQILGKIDYEKILDNIFSKFCIGK